MIISAIVATGLNNEIGVDNDLPWHLPADLKFFKETTLKKYVLLGRKSFESIGRPLPGRTNIVITRDKDYYHSGIIIKHSISDGILYAKENGQDELFVLGGSNIYGQTQEIWDQFYQTKINVEIPHATAFFPKVNYDNWSLAWSEEHQADEKNKYNYSFNKYVRS